jgi:hypothetical protein
MAKSRGGRASSPSRVLTGSRTIDSRMGAAAEESTITKLGKRVQIMGECWVVDGQMDVYPQCGNRQRRGPAHRFVYSEVHDVTVPADVHIHHTCETPGCIRPDHLVAIQEGDHIRVHAQRAHLADVAIDPETFAAEVAT